jgi:two-component system response regulator AtoC
MQILIVDDEAGMLTLLKLLLDRLGHESIPTSHGEQALAALQDNSPDFVITDLMMPDMSGQTLIQEIRATHPDLPILVVTAVTDTYTLRDVVTNGATHVVNKPITRVSLQRAIEITLENA